nr:sensor histidine kinase [Hymenobacter translucens]
MGLRYYFRAKKLAEDRQNYILLTPILGNIGNAYLQAGKLDSALLYTRQGYDYDLRYHDRHSEIGDLSLLGDVEARRGNHAAADEYYRRSIARAQGMPVSYALCRSYLGLAQLARTRQEPELALAYGRQALEASRRGRYAKGVFEASGYLAEIHAARGNSDEAYRFLAVAAATRDSLFSQTKVAQVQALSFSEQLRQQELAEEGALAAAERRQNILLAALVLATLLGGLTYLLLSRRHLRREVEFAQQLQQLQQQRAAAVLEAESAERRRIGLDLHDGVGQLLSAAKMQIGALREELGNLSTPEQDHRFRETMDIVDESVREVRSISHNLMPNALIKRGLVRAVQEFLDKIRQPARLRIHLETIGLEQRLPAAVEVVLYRIIQELVQNIIKHARATELTLQLIRHEGEVTVLVEDNGVGFEVQDAEHPPEAGIGLRNIASRVAYLRGRFNVDSRPGRGTTISVEVPIYPEPETISAGQSAGAHDGALY